MRYWMVKNTVNTTKYVENGLAAIGWSENKLDPSDIETTIAKVSETYGLTSDRSSGWSKGAIRRFLSISKGDIVIVPCYKGFYMGYSTGDFIYCQDCYADDRANALKVDFIKDGEGKPVYYAREGKNTALSTKIGSRHLVLEIYEDKIKEEIDFLLEEKADVSIENRINNLENIERDELKKKICEELSDYSKTWLDAKGAGFEALVANLFETEGYETCILSKRIGGSSEADADILAIKNSRLNPQFNEVIYIQAKHHSGVTGLWGLEQIKAFKAKIEKDSNNGIMNVRDLNGKDITIDTANIKYALISSAKIDSRAYETNETTAAVDRDDVILIDGADVSEMIIEHLEEMNISLRRKLGLIKQFVHIDDYT